MLRTSGWSPATIFSVTCRHELVLSLGPSAICVRLKPPKLSKPTLSWVELALAIAAKEKLSLRPLFSNREAPHAEAARQLDLNFVCD